MYYFHQTTQICGLMKVTLYLWQKNSFADIWRSGSTDVHPVLYYFMLKVIGLLTGNSILAYRLFSAVPLIILAILGFSHIKRTLEKKLDLHFRFSVIYASYIDLCQ